MALAVLVQNPIELLVLSTATNTVAATPFLIVAMLISKNKSMAGKPQRRTRRSTWRGVHRSKRGVKRHPARAPQVRS